jgi:hypothetical protein
VAEGYAVLGQASLQRAHLRPRDVPDQMRQTVAGHGLTPVAQDLSGVA